MEEHDEKNKHRRQNITSPRYADDISAPAEEAQEPGPEVIKLFSCSTQLRMKIFLLINVKIQQLLAFEHLCTEKKQSRLI